MPTVTLDRKVVDKLIGKKLSDDNLKEKISYLGTDLEHIDSKEIHVEIFPNRPDMLSEQGFARAFSSFIGLKKGLRKYNVTKSSEKLIIDSSVKNVRPFSACAIVKGLEFNNKKIKEIIQIQEKLHVTYGRNRKRVAIGIYPNENIKYPIRFLAKSPKDIEFQPLEYPKSINGLKILSSHPAGRDYGHLLEGKDKFPLFIDSNNQVLSMPPIINSHNVGKIGLSTKDVFIECSGFDYEVLSKCLNIIVSALNDMGGEVFSMEIEMYGKKVISPNLNPKQMKIDIDYVNKRLGLTLNEVQLKDNLEKMGFDYSKGIVYIPPYRTDILHQIDFVEDIAIAYGYDKFKAELPKVSTVGKENEFEKFKNKLRNIVVGLGLIECKTFHLTNKINQCNKMDIEVPLIQLANALNEDYDVLRSWIIPSLMDILRTNKHHEYPQNIFTIGSIFKKGNDKTETGIIENQRMSCLLCSENSDYTKIMQVFDYLMRMSDTEYKVETTEHKSFIPGRVARISVKGKNIAYIGELSPQVLTNWDIEMPVSAFELNLTELF